MFRCTGYRPILDAFKSFASDYPGRNISNSLPDIEELKLCKRTGAPCAGSCPQRAVGGSSGCHAPRAEDFQWLVPTTLEEVRTILSSLPAGTKYRSVIPFFLNPCINNIIRKIIFNTITKVCKLIAFLIADECQIFIFSVGERGRKKELC